MTIRGINDVHGDAQYLSGDQDDDFVGENEKNEDICRIMFVEEVHIEG